MVAKNGSNKSNQTSVRSSGLWSSLIEFLKEKADGLNIFQRILLCLYILMTFFFLAAAFYLVFTKGFKY
jgi:hypothetical protein